jgi:hypothetical protein
MSSLKQEALAGSSRGRSLAALALIALLSGLGHSALAQDASTPQPGDDPSPAATADSPSQDATADPPSQVARISLIQGNVSVEPASVDQFSAAEANYPLTTGDRIYADVGAAAELQTGDLALRLGPQADLTVTAMTDTLSQLGLAAGSAHLRTYSLEPNATVELDTPNIAVTVLQPGDVRVDVDPQSDATVVSLISGQVQIDGNGFQQVLSPGQRVRLSGSDTIGAQWLNPVGEDGLDELSGTRDTDYENGLASAGQYVNGDTIGAADLSANGDWESDSDNGPVWYPTAVAAGWQPYSCGRWAWVAPWGWTWVECESWGFAPFHYGRWVHRGPRWGWIPGPPTVRPYYSPALVVFVGGGAGVTAWFPLGPREPYVPWYHASPLYLNRVNVSNIYTRNTVQVLNIYNQRVANVYNTTTVVNHVYVNREVATIAVSQTSFAAGRRVTGAEVHPTPEALAAGTVLPHPLVTPQRSMIVSAPARAVPVRSSRPGLASRVDTSVKPPVIQTPNPARTVERLDPTPAPVERASPEPPTNPEPRPNPEPRTNPAAQPPAAPAPPRVLFNKAVPPDPRPSFDAQQKAINETDPGRPLSPQQLNNIRQNQPAGRPQETEKPHPAATPKPAPASRTPPPAAEKKH